MITIGGIVIDSYKDVTGGKLVIFFHAVSGENVAIEYANIPRLITELQNILDRQGKDNQE